MAKKLEAAGEPAAPIRPLPAVIGLAWLIPGAGHFLLQKRGRAAILFACVFLTFVFGLMMRGAFFFPKSGDLLTTIIYWGGFIGDLAGGLLYLMANWLGYNQQDVPGHVHDYGTKFLVAAGLLNILAMVDAYEIATRKKE